MFMKYIQVPSPVQTTPDQTRTVRHSLGIPNQIVMSCHIMSNTRPENKNLDGNAKKPHHVPTPTV